MKLTLISIILVLAYLITPAFSATIIPFSSPENSYQTISDFILGLRKSVYISGYTFSSQEFAGVLADSEKRGVQVKIVLEDKPVGEDINIDLLCSLQVSGAEVYIYRGKLNYLHAKYIIGDNTSAVITSENFGPDGFQKNRGWGVVVEDSKITKGLMEVYLRDLKDSEKIRCENSRPIKENKPSPILDKKLYEKQEATLVVAPDAVNGLVSLINSANKSIYIEQFYVYKNWGGRPNVLLEAVIKKAREGVDVKMLLDSSPYNTEEKDPKSNYNTIEYIMNISSSENLSLDAKLVDLGGLGFEKIHNKGLIIDNSTVLVSSINWNENSPRKNREIGIAVKGDSANYFVEKFFSDWQIESSSSLQSGKIAGKDYGKTALDILIFIAIVSVAMFCAKRRLYRRNLNRRISY